MHTTQLYDEIYRAITKTASILELMGLEDATPLDLAKRVQKRRQPMNIDKSMPLITFYCPGGRHDSRNDAVYGAGFVFDVYTNDDVELAQDISTELCELFDNELANFSGLTTFQTKLQDQYESLTDRQNVYCYTTVMVFFIGLDD